MTIVYEDMLGSLTFAELGLRVLRESQRPILPSTVDRSIVLAGKNGAWDFGANLGPMQFALKCAFVGLNTPLDLQFAVRKLTAHLLNGDGTPKTLNLVFKIDPDKYYQVRYSGSMPIDRLVGLGTFTLPLTAFDPIAKLRANVDDITMGSIIMAAYPLTAADKYSFVINSSPYTVTVNNFGTANVMPTINLTGSFDSLSIATNGKTLVYSDALASGTLSIQNDKYKATYGSVNKNNKVSGDWITLIPGDNYVTFGGTNLNVTADFSFEPRFL